MSIRTWLTPLITERLFSLQRLQRQRAAAERRRLRRDEPHRVDYFHQVDDPYCALMAARLQDLLARYDIALVPHMVGPPPDAAAPDRARLVAYSRVDAARLAQHLGLWFVDPGRQPAPEAVARAQALLLAAVPTGRFAELAGEVSRALWQGQPLPAPPGIVPAAPAAVQAHLAESQALRQRLGHYLGATLHYGGEWYWGLDRLHHLEQRLREVHAARGTAPGWLAAPELDAEGPAATPLQPGAPVVDFYFSLRSPYSAIAAPRVLALARHHGAAVRLRYLLPMVMRGLPVPPIKRRYISLDAAREARLHGVPFGRLNDPVGRPTERGLAVLAHADAQGRGPDFLLSFMRGVWSEGIDAGSDRGLQRIADRAGLGAAEVRAALADEAWRAQAAANRDEMADLGLWGVPSFRVGDVSAWGQDRLWVVREALQAAAMPRRAA
ncbi:MAG: DsbA family protein [Aquabacterium sp.]